MTPIILRAPLDVRSGPVSGPVSGTSYTLDADRLISVPHVADAIALIGAGWAAPQGLPRELTAGTITGTSAPVTIANAVIAATDSLSDAIDLGAAALVGVILPANLGDATKITFEVSYDGDTFADLYDSDGNEYVVTVAADRAVKIPLGDLMSAKAIKLRLGTAAIPVPAASDLTLLLSLRP
jgi:hypothetical protein